MPSHYALALRDGISRTVQATLSRPDALAHLAGLGREIAETAETLLAHLLLSEPPPEPLDCRAGCNHCCHWFEIHVTALEILFLADAIPAADRADLLRRTESLTAEKHRIQDETGERSPSTCPLLADGVCRSYEYRPMVCRGMTSFSRENCEKRSGVFGYLHNEQVARAVMDGIRLGIHGAGLSGIRLDLAPALWVALAEPDIARRWLAGEEVFAAAEAIIRKP